jgi:3-deoxy-manno-octulosonate cytidylyltransferase (CMP-KDO synthetase)
MSTLKVALNDEREIQNTNVVKVVTDLEGYAIYFSRFPIPFSRKFGDNAYFKHIGLYVYRKDFLLRFTNLPQGPLELAEGLEQLRALEHGFKIKVEMTKYDTIGVDTREDLKRVEAVLSARSAGT